MPRKQKKHHYIYKTTCNITSRFYIGMHSTNELNDGYLGSGTILWRSLNKYGKENHKVEILEYLNDRISLKEREKQIVNEEIIQDASCMNLQLGGEGGFSSKEHAYKFQAGGVKAYVNKLKNDLEWRKKHLLKKSLIMKKIWKNPEHREKELQRLNSIWIGKKHKQETKDKIGKANSISQKGTKNSQYGTCWITNEKKSKKIFKGDLIPKGWKLGRNMVSVA